jgi:hypothetical protein
METHDVMMTTLKRLKMIHRFNGMDVSPLVYSTDTNHSAGISLDALNVATSDAHSANI